jgi:hypothetical protein
MYIIYNSKPLVAGCNKLPNHNQFEKELKDLLIKGYYSTQAYLTEEFCNTGYTQLDVQNKLHS